jgi:hypothetical protein
LISDECYSILLIVRLNRSLRRTSGLKTSSR